VFYTTNCEAFKFLRRLDENERGKQHPEKYVNPTKESKKNDKIQNKNVEKEKLVQSDRNMKTVDTPIGSVEVPDQRTANGKPVKKSSEEKAEEKKKAKKLLRDNPVNGNGTHHSADGQVIFTYNNITMDETTKILTEVEANNTAANKSRKPKTILTSYIEDPDAHAFVLKMKRDMQLSTFLPTKKTIFNDKKRVLFVAGLEGSGHHALHSMFDICFKDKLCVADQDISHDIMWYDPG
jgi:hypothetical protein